MPVEKRQLCVERRGRIERRPLAAAVGVEMTFGRTDLLEGPHRPAAMQVVVGEAATISAGTSIFGKWGPSACHHSSRNGLLAVSSFMVYFSRAARRPRLHIVRKPVSRMP